MPNESVSVTITKVAGNDSRCRSTPDPFRIQRGGVVTFVFDQERDAVIVFKGESPFDQKNFRPGNSATVRMDAPQNKKFSYDVSWVDGVGNGTGEIIP